jgi:hypothetical protein
MCSSFVFLCSIAAAALAGCATHEGFQNGTIGPVSSTHLTLSVVNYNFEDVRVYLLRENLTMPVGIVEAMQSRSFRIPQARLGSTGVLRLAFVTTTSNTRLSMVPLDCEPGQTIEARIGTFLQNSNVFIKPTPAEY